MGFQNKFANMITIKSQNCANIGSKNFEWGYLYDMDIFIVY
jgi:hypothetical protein